MHETMDITIYHNPRCSKSRQTLQILQDNNIQPRIIEYLKTPPSHTQVQQWLSILNYSPRELMRTKEDIYTTLNLGDESLSNTQLIQAMIDNPKLIERPIVVKKNTEKEDEVVIGRPPENVLSFFEDQIS